MKVVEAFVGEEDMICQLFQHLKIKKLDRNGSNPLFLLLKKAQGILILPNKPY